jgi:peptidyl-dipeptidase Dcp
MRGLSIRSIVLLVTITMIATILINPTNNSSAMNVNTDNNPLLAKWEGPYGGVPPFDRVQIPLFRPRRSPTIRRHLISRTRLRRSNVLVAR